MPYFTGQDGQPHQRFTRAELLKGFTEIDGDRSLKAFKNGTYIVYQIGKGKVYEGRSLSEARQALSAPHLPSDLRAMIDNAADLIAKDWYRQACRNPYAVFYLWYRAPVTGEMMSLPIASIDAPNEDYTRDMALSGMWSIQTAKIKIAERMHQLPLLNPAVGS